MLRTTPDAGSVAQPEPTSLGLLLRPGPDGSSRGARVQPARRVGASGLPGRRPGPLDPAPPNAGATRRGASDSSGRRAGEGVRPPWLMSRHGAASTRGLAGECQAGGADLAPGGPDGAEEAARKLPAGSRDRARTRTSTENPALTPYLYRASDFLAPTSQTFRLAGPGEDSG